MERILAETARSIEIMQKRKANGDDFLYIAKYDPNHVPILEDPKIREFRNDLNAMGFTDVDIQNRVFNDPRCTDAQAAANLYLRFQPRSPSS